MPDSSPTPLTDQAMKRLRALANGNGIEPDAIKLMQGEEKVYTLEGIMSLTPLCDVQSRSYAGAPGGKTTQIFADAGALQQEVTKRQAEFRGHPNWINEVKQELQTAPAGGWGLDGVKVTLAARDAVLAASAICPQCRGHKMITCANCQGRRFAVCVQCRGQRQELCYNCGGSGQNPQQPNQACLICNGARYITCRRCRGTGQTPCPVCGARGGTPCPACKGVGQATQEVHMTFGATAHFRLKGGVLPSGLRRGLDRLGIANLTKGHADIEIVEPKEEKEEDYHPDEDHPPPAKAPDPELHYQAMLPFAELRIDFGGSKAAVGAFGKRGVLLDVPPFLEEALQPWRQKLADAARGKGSLGEAIKARALHDALGLALQGKGNATEFRRLYSVGFSGDVVNEIVINIRKAIKKTTLRIRIAVAAGFTILSAALFTGCYFSSLPMQLAHSPKWVGLGLDLVPLAVAEGMAWLALNAAMRLILRKDFPDMKIAHRQTPTKTGYFMMAAISAVWLAILILSPARPLWLPLQLH